MTPATDLISVKGMGGLLCVEQVHLLVVLKHFHLHVLLALTFAVLVDLCDALGQARGGQPERNQDPESYFPMLKLTNFDHTTFTNGKL